MKCFDDSILLDWLESNSESFIRIDRFYNAEGYQYKGITLCSKQTEKPITGIDIREAITRTMFAQMESEATNG